MIPLDGGRDPGIGEMDPDLNALIAEMRRAVDLDGVKRAFTLALERYGISAFTYGGVRLPRSGSPDPVIVTTYPDTWVSHYVDRGYQQRDPVVRVGQSAFLPFSWTGLDPLGPEREVLEEGKSVGLKSGLSIPAHGALGEFALISLASTENTAEFAACAQAHQHELHILAMHFHACVAELSAARGKQPEVKLTRRETEVMTWIAHGKTTWEISEILRISEPTVVFHCENAKKKLGAFSRSYAVAKALSLGLLRL